MQLDVDVWMLLSLHLQYLIHLCRISELIINKLTGMMIFYPSFFSFFLKEKGDGDQMVVVVGIEHWMTK